MLLWILEADACRSMCARFKSPALFWEIRLKESNVRAVEKVSARPSASQLVEACHVLDQYSERVMLQGDGVLATIKEQVDPLTILDCKRVQSVLLQMQDTTDAEGFACAALLGAVRRLQQQHEQQPQRAILSHAQASAASLRPVLHHCRAAALGAGVQ